MSILSFTTFESNVQNSSEKYDPKMSENLGSEKNVHKFEVRNFLKLMYEKF